MGIRIRTKSDWYEQREKSTKFFLNLEKQCDIPHNLQKLSVNDGDTTDETEILIPTKQFYETLFKK